MELTGNPHGAAEEPPGPEILAIRCSACNTLYRVSPEQIPEGGRRVKCSRCGHVWFQGSHSVYAEAEAAHPDSWAAAEQPVPMAGYQEPLMDDPAAAVSAGYSSEDRDVERNGLTALLWLIGTLAVLVLILGVHVFAPRIAAAIPALAPFLSTYVDVVGSALAWIAETVTAVVDGLRNSFQSYES